jgi:hypothetical protein
MVLVETGPLAGARGIIDAGDNNKKRLVISVTLLQRSVAVQLGEDTVISVAADLKGNKTRDSAESDMAAVLLK